MKGTLSSLSIIKGDSVMLRISLLQFNGQINNVLNSNHAKFFNYPLDQISELQNIDQIMPPLFHGMHRYFIQRIYKKENINIKNTDRQLFMSDRYMFITPINIYLDFCFSDNNNFNMIGILSKVKSFKRYLVFNQKGFLNGIQKDFCQILLGQYRGSQAQGNTDIGDYQVHTNFMQKMYKSMSMAFLFP